MKKHYLEKNPLVSQRNRALKITKSKDESISDLSEKVINWLVEAMRVEPNIKSLDQASVYIQ